jgi:hypothetical protein
MKRAQMNIFVILHAILGVQSKLCGPLMKNSHYLTNCWMKFGEKVPSNIAVTRKVESQLAESTSEPSRLNKVDMVGAIFQIASNTSGARKNVKGQK